MVHALSRFMDDQSSPVVCMKSLGMSDIKYHITHILLIRSLKHMLVAGRFYYFLQKTVLRIFLNILCLQKYLSCGKSWTLTRV